MSPTNFVFSGWKKNKKHEKARSISHAIHCHTRQRSSVYPEKRLQRKGNPHQHAAVCKPLSETRCRHLSVQLLTIFVCHPRDPFYEQLPKRNSVPSRASGLPIFQKPARPSSHLTTMLPTLHTMECSFSRNAIPRNSPYSLARDLWSPCIYTSSTCLPILVYTLSWGRSRASGVRCPMLCQRSLDISFLSFHRFHCRPTRNKIYLPVIRSAGYPSMLSAWLAAYGEWHHKVRTWGGVGVVCWLIGRLP